MSNVFSNVIKFLQVTTLGFRALCLSLTCISCLVFMISMAATGEWLIGGMIGVTIFAFFQLFYWFFGSAASIAFFIIYVFITFHFTGDNIRMNREGAWLEAHPEYGNLESDDSRITGSGFYNKYHQTAMSFDSNLQHDWLSSNTEAEYVQYNHFDTVTPCMAAIKEFHEWFSTHDWRTDGEPPVPTIPFMDEYIRKVNHYDGTGWFSTDRQVFHQDHPGVKYVDPNGGSVHY